MTRTAINNPIADTQSVAIASPAPSVATNHAQRGVTAATQAVAGKEMCNACGADWQQAHFTQGGRLLCETCWQGQRAATAMPCTKAQQQALFEWMQPHRGAQP